MHFLSGYMPVKEGVYVVNFVIFTLYIGYSENKWWITICLSLTEKGIEVYFFVLYVFVFVFSFGKP